MQNVKSLSLQGLLLFGGNYTLEIQLYDNYVIINSGINKKRLQRI